MGRQIRLNLPGVPFHLTARVQGRGPMFAGLEHTVATLIMGYSAASDTELLAYAVMPNHLHMVSVQGRKPLAALMQPLLRRIALRVKRERDIEGHIFERRYFAKACLDADYLRNALAYVHLNPMRAKLCVEVEHPHTSHSTYCSDITTPASRFEAAVLSALRLFGAETHSTPSACRAAYLQFLRWRIRMDASADADGISVMLPPPQLCGGGNDYWEQEYGPAALAAQQMPRSRRPEDLSQIAKRVIHELEPDMPLELLRSGARTKPVVRVRREFVLRSVGAGYGACQLAGFLGVDASSVSRLSRAVLQPVLLK